MYNPFKTDEKPSVIEPVIDKLISEMSGYDASDEDYSTMAANLKTLMEAKAVEPRKPRVSPETWAIIGGNLAGIVAILAFEKNGIITSRAFSLVTRTR